MQSLSNAHFVRLDTLSTSPPLGLISVPQTEDEYHTAIKQAVNEGDVERLHELYSESYAYKNRLFGAKIRSYLDANVFNILKNVGIKVDPSQAQFMPFMEAVFLYDRKKVTDLLLANRINDAIALAKEGSGYMRSLYDGYRKQLVTNPADNAKILYTLLQHEVAHPRDMYRDRRETNFTESLRKESLRTTLELGKILRANQDQDVYNFIQSLDAVPQKNLLRKIMTGQSEDSDLEDAHFDFEEV